MSPAKLLVVDNEFNETLSEKNNCYKYLGSIGLETPLVYTNSNDMIYPLVMKPIKGSGSKNVVIINDLEELKYWAKRNTNYILIEYLNGKEYTVDCFFDNEGVCYGANVRERIKMNGGGAVVTKNNYDIQIQPILEKLEQTKRIRGPSKFPIQDY